MGTRLCQEVEVQLLSHSLVWESLLTKIQVEYVGLEDKKGGNMA